ncbi:hypothetical protein ABBQ32_008647 [Trebouxia sp. C0010 RCD-2024]
MLPASVRVATLEHTSCGFLKSMRLNLFAACQTPDLFASDKDGWETKIGCPVLSSSRETKDCEDRTCFAVNHGPGAWWYRAPQTFAKMLQWHQGIASGAPSMQPTSVITCLPATCSLRAPVVVSLKGSSWKAKGMFPRTPTKAVHLCHDASLWSCIRAMYAEQQQLLQQHFRPCLSFNTNRGALCSSWTV